MTTQAQVLLPLEGNESMGLYTADGTQVATGYTRVVVGGRGCYVEIAPTQMCKSHLHVKAGQQWRRRSSVAYYEWLECAGAKVYYQRRTVRYADYKVGMCYVDPADLFTADGESCAMTQHPIIPPNEHWGVGLWSIGDEGYCPCGGVACDGTCDTNTELRRR